MEVIAWLAAQPWCSGIVGMMGISWGGFNGLQIAARRPPARPEERHCASFAEAFCGSAEAMLFSSVVHYRLSLRPTTSFVPALALAATLLSIVVAMALPAPPVAHGQDRGAGREERGARDERSAPESAEPDAPATSDDVDAQSREVSEGGEKVKAIRFSGLDVAGRLKSPQLLYFLNRLRAEFDRPRLPHRSFLPEMERSARSKSF